LNLFRDGTGPFERADWTTSTPVKCRPRGWQETGLEMWGGQGGQHGNVGGGTQTTWKNGRRLIDVCCRGFQIQTSTNIMCSPATRCADLFDSSRQPDYHLSSVLPPSRPWCRLPLWHSHELLLPETASALSCFPPSFTDLVFFPTQEEVVACGTTTLTELV
jgi:hypothetical protein